MRLIIIGASGSIGGHLLKAARSAGHATVGTYATQPQPGLRRFDLERGRIGDLVPDLGSGDCVFLLSAKVDPNWVHAHPDESRRLNVEATIRGIDDVLARGSHMVFLSTEAVFGDDRADGYGEGDTPDPSTLYAQQKAEVEAYLGADRPNRCIVRTGWNVGWESSGRCPVLNTYKTLQSMGAKMAIENYFTITDILDTVFGLLCIAEKSRSGIFHLASNPPVSRIELADQVIARSKHGHAMRYDAVPFGDIPYKEPRPRRAWLRNDKAKRELDLRFREPTAIIAKKVALLDEWFG